MKELLIKVCGMTDAENIRQVEQAGATLMGFIFYPKSPRYLHRMPDYLPEKASRVGVFVNESREEVMRHAERFGLEFAQLHGNESPEYCQCLREACGLRLIKAFSLSQAEDLHSTTAYEGLCDYYLFDTKSPQYGGSGICFNWNLLDNYHGSTPFLLSGGINASCIPAIRELKHPLMAGLDLNSRFETRPGLKDVALIRKFVHELQASNI